MNLPDENQPSGSQQAKAEVERFVAHIRQRLNTFALWHGLLWSALISAGILSAISLGYVALGYQVPRLYYLWLPLGALILAVGFWIRWRVSTQHAAHLVDQQFGLKDAVRSCRNFAMAGQDDGFYKLQALQTQLSLSPKNAEEFRFTPQLKVVIAAIGLTLLALGLAFKGPSPAVLAQQQLEQITLESTAKLKQDLEKLLDELEQEAADSEEKELLNPNKLREWVKEMQTTGDPREAMRQFSKLERKLQQAAAALQNRKDEQLLDRAAKELKKDVPNRDLAELMKQKKYDQAAEKLKDLKLTKDQNKGKENPDKKLTQEKKDLAKLRAAAQRMASVTKQNARKDAGLAKGSDRKTSTNQRNSKDNLRRAGNNNQKNADSDQQLAENGEANDEELGELAENLQELEEAVEECEMAMEEWEEGDENDEDQEGECEPCRGRVNKNLDDLAKKLTKMARKRAAQARLKQLSQKFSQANSRGAARSGVPNPNPGGKLAGKGTSDSRRDPNEQNPETKGFKSNLKGIHGDGPSLTQIQSAESGTGVSGRTAEAVQRDFQRQFESYIEREDIPEDLKTGVKNYFMQIHQPPDQSKEE